MTDISRRKYLSASAIAALTSMAGCAIPNLTNDGKKNEYTEIKDIRVKPTPDGYNQDSPHFAVISDNLQEQYSIGKHEQIRLRIQADSMEQWRLRPALFTTKVEPDFTSKEDNTIWLSDKGMERIFAEPNMIISALPFATSPLLETRDVAQANNEFIEQSVTKSGDLLACASSGGQIFKNTDLQALHISSESESSSWIAAGYDDRNRAYTRWHVSPELLNPDSYNNVRFLIEDETHDYAVNFIGIPGDYTSTIYIGGLVEESIQKELKKNLEEQFKNKSINPTIKIKHGGELSGTDTENIVNRFTQDGDNGIQIAQSTDIHTDYWKPVAEAVLATFKDNSQF